MHRLVKDRDPSVRAQDPARSVAEIIGARCETCGAAVWPLTAPCATCEASAAAAERLAYRVEPERRERFAGSYAFTFDRAGTIAVRVEPAEVIARVEIEAYRAREMAPGFTGTQAEIMGGLSFAWGESATDPGAYVLRVSSSELETVWTRIRVYAAPRGVS